MDLVLVAAWAILFVFHTTGLFLFILGRRVVSLLANGAFEGNNVSHCLSFRPLPQI